MRPDDRLPGALHPAVTASRGPAVAVVSYNTRDLLRGLLASVRAEAPPETVVVDNGSSDGSAEMVRAEFPAACLIVDPYNPGFGAAANQAVAATSSDYVLILNGDTRLSPGTLAALGDYLDRNPRCAIAGPLLTSDDGRSEASCFPFLGTFRLALEKSSLGRGLARVPAVRDHYLILHGPRDRPRIVPWVQGSALAVRRSAFEAVGGFDSRFFMYAEEVDLCYRLQKAGWEVHFAPVARVVHVGGASTAGRRVEMEVQRVRGARQFYRRHYSPLRAAALERLIQGAMAWRLVRDRTRFALARENADRARLAQNLAVWRGALRS
jgi:N-acetylglucosaminyl-diphospho-decaprenol L-rhamnosyltransferase